MSRPAVCFIVNPAGNRGRAAAVWRDLERRLGPRTNWDAWPTREHGHASELAAKAAAEGWERVCAVGGDGTLGQVADGLVGSRSALAWIPAGSANDFARTVGIPTAPAAALEVALWGGIIRCDLGYAVGHRHFINVSGAGFDGVVTQRMARAAAMQRTLGVTPTYLVQVLTALAGFEGFPVRMVIDGDAVEAPKLALAAVGVARSYGDGMMILPDAMIDDGLLDVAWGDGLSRAELLGLVPRIYKGSHLRHPKVFTRRCQEIVLESDVPDAPFHLDGDLSGRLPVTFRSVPRAIGLVVPEQPVGIPARSAFRQLADEAASTPEPARFG